MRQDESLRKTTTAVIGIDGSEGSRHALLWLLRRPSLADHIRPVATYSIPPIAAPYGMGTASPSIGKVYREAAESAVDELVNAVDDPRIMPKVVFESSAGPGLVTAAEDADLLVVGSRGRSALAEIVLGSVGSYCVKHGKLPVIVVPPDAPVDGSVDRVVVGVDGSPNGQAALDWALGHVADGGTVVVVHSYQLVPYPPEVAHPALELLEQEAATRLDAALDGVVPQRGVTIEREVRLGDPRNVLVELAKDADLLVIGARGHKGVAYLLLGSVSTSLLHHPQVPTVVVPES